MCDVFSLWHLFKDWISCESLGKNSHMVNYHFRPNTDFVTVTQQNQPHSQLHFYIKHIPLSWLLSEKLRYYLTMFTYLYFDSSRKTWAFNISQQQLFLLSLQILLLKFKATQLNYFSLHNSALKQFIQTSSWWQLETSMIIIQLV